MTRTKMFELVNILENKYIEYNGNNKGDNKRYELIK